MIRGPLEFFLSPMTWHVLEAPNWERDGHDWPNRDHSRFVEAAGISWHVQVAGAGPVLLILHGAGGATHSFSQLLPNLARDFTVVAADLPGHGFTGTPRPLRLSIPTIAAAVATLLTKMNVVPRFVIGHSAGAAILVRMCLDGHLAPDKLISLNGALVPFGGAAASTFFSPITQMLAGVPAIPHLIAWNAAISGIAHQLVRDTGSTISPQQLALYQRLIERPAHVAATLDIMARWDLVPLAAELLNLTTPLTLVVATNDRTIPPSQAEEVCALLPTTTLIKVPGLGHLAHEESPQEIADIIRVSTGLQTGTHQHRPPPSA